jgi:hypothetical protein
MPDTILHKRNLTPGVAPTTESLSVGELAINVADRKLYTRSGSAIVILNDNTGSFTGSFTGELIGTASFATTASYAPTILPNGLFSSSLQVDYTDIQNKPTTIETASYVQFSNIANKPTLISSSTQFTNITEPFTGSFTGSFTGEFIGTASFTTSASYAPTILPSGVISSSAQVTASINGAIITPAEVSGSDIHAQTLMAHRWLELYPTDIAISPDPDSAYFYISGSSNDLWYTHKTDSTVNFDWIEGVLETGLIHGGINGFNGSEVHIRSGSGIIVNHGANTGSASSPTVTYVNWPVITGSIDVTQGFVTYLAINANGILESSSTKFTSLDYHDKIPLGAVGHFNQQAIAAKGEQVNTQYSQTAQLTDFARNFGPIKVGGYGITAQSGSLKFTRAAGNAFIYGGFYSQNPETPSDYQSPSVSTGSLAYIYRSGSAYTVDANNNNFYTDLKPGWYDNGGLTTASLASNEWSIQRVFIEPVTGIHYIYFGQAKYTSLANAVSNILTDPFAEGPATTLFTVFVGYLVMKGDTTNLADTGSNDIISAGLFRNTSAGSVGGGAAAQLLNDLSDVTVTSPSNGQALIYSSGNWINGTPANATSASYATSGSYTVTASFATSASYAPTILPDGIFSSSLQVDYTQIQNKPTTIETASYVEYVNVANKPALISSSAQINELTGVSASFATTSSAATSITFIPTSASFATTSSAATSITFTPATASFSTTSSFATTASAATSITFTPSTASFATSASYAPTILPSGIFSSSLQVDYTQIQNKPTTIETASYVEYNNVANKPALVSSSGQISYTGITNVPSGILSSSTQINELTGVSASFATTSSFATSASFATTASFATSASFAPYAGLRTKAGSVANTSFAGNPRKATVNFATAFPNTSYAVTVTGEDARSWTIESKAAGSFVINANSNTNLTGTTYWTAMTYGET